MRGLKSGLTLLGALALSGLLGPTVARASIPIHHASDVSMTELKPWSDVEDVQKQLEAGHGIAFDGGYQGRLLLTDDGRLVELYGVSDSEPARGAMLGRFERDGNWLTLRPTARAVNLSALDAEELAMFEASINAYREAMQARAEVGVDASGDAEASAFEFPEQRYLLVSLAEGELLVADDQSLKWAIQRWEPGEPLELYVRWRNGKQLHGGDEHTRELKIADPLNAGLPVELSRLLTREPVQAQLVDVLDSEDTLKWKAHETTVRVKLDRGEHQGVYRDMQLLGLPPDEGLRLTVVESSADESIAELAISRFSPADPPALPTPGARLISRQPASMNCHFNTAMPVSAKITALSPKADELVFDEDGFAFVTLTLDAGNSAGFLLDEEVNTSDYVGGEGRVRGMDKGSTTVLWRVRRYAEDYPVELPKVGDEIGTSAWRMEQWEKQSANENLQEALKAMDASDDLLETVEEMELD